MSYYFEDFIESNYKTILEKLIQEGYEFIEFDFDKINTGIKYVLWRHDVDHSLNRAYRMAEIEELLSIKATYFIHMQNSFYNMFEPDQYEIIKKIINKGHTIGLHFDHGFYTQNKGLVDDNEIEKYAVMEKEMMEKYFDIKINAVSFHNPEASNVLNLKQDYYAGMINAYSKTISDNCKYCSDSNGYWRYDRLQDVIENGYEKLHILTHPAWWTAQILSPFERIKKCVDGRSEAVLENYCHLLKESGRENVGYS